MLVRFKEGGKLEEVGRDRFATSGSQREKNLLSLSVISLGFGTAKVFVKLIPFGIPFKNVYSWPISIVCQKLRLVIPLSL